MAFRAPPPSAEDRQSQRPRAGLCADCRHFQLLRSKISLFVRCGLSDHDSKFNRYPPLPVTFCPGFIRNSGDESHSDDPQTPAPAGR